MAHDLLVKLYDLKDSAPIYKRMEEEGIYIKRALMPDYTEILKFVGEHFSQNFVNEATCAILNHNCFIAVKDKQVIGFACIEVMKNFFGPTGVNEAFRGKGVGGALLMRSLEAMRDMGYAYAIIGWVGDALDFYKKVIDPIVLENSHPGGYKSMIMYDGSY